MDEQLKSHSIDYMRIATIHRVYAIVVAQVAKGEWSHEEIGARLDKPTKWVAKTLSSPSGWTLNLVSDLCLAMNCEIAFHIFPFQRRVQPDSTSS